MPIRPFLASQVFEPELILQMSLALESVCETLELSFTDDPATRLVASKGSVQSFSHIWFGLSGARH